MPATTARDSAARWPIARWQLGCALAAVAVVSVLGAVAASALFAPWRSVALHATLDAAGGFAYLSVGALLLVLVRSDATSARSFPPACGLIAMGALELFHAAPRGGIVLGTAALANLAGGLGFALRLLPMAALSSRTRRVAPWLVFASATAVGLLSMLFRERIPSLLRPDGHFTTAAVTLHLAAGALFAVGLASFFVGQKRVAKGDAFLSSFCLLSAVVSVQLSQPWGPTWWWWHWLHDIAAAVLGLVAFNAYERLHSELEEALALRDQFLVLAAHELRTPIAAARLHGDLTHKTLRRASAASPVFAEAADRMTKVLAQIDRLRGLVEEIMDVANARAGRLTMNPRPTDLRAVVDRAIADIADDLAAAHCTVEKRVEDGVHGEWDAARIEQVLTNLLVNAKTFGAGRPIVVEVSSSDGHARLAVRDEGVGIEARDKSRIFDRFERVDVEHAARGLGLGLTIAREIVEAHGGRIWVESELGAGATFVVELPCRRASQGGAGVKAWSRSVAT